MSTRYLSTTVQYIAIDSITTARVSGDAANHTLTGYSDGVPFSPITAPISLGNGEYRITLTANENSGSMMKIDGVSSTPNVIIVPTSWENFIGNVAGTPDGTVAIINPYTTVEEGNEYFQQVLYTEDWDGASDDNKRKAINKAHQVVEQYSYMGLRSTTTQTNEWPRQNLIIQGTNGQVLIDPTVIPDEIKIAELLIAKIFLGGYDEELEARNRGITSRRYASISTTYDTNNVPDHVQAECPSAQAWSFLRRYVNRTTSGTVIIRKVN